MESYPLLVGVDWGNEAHQVCVMRPDREVLAEFAVPHDGKHLVELSDRLARHAGDHGPAGVAIAIEVPRGPVVETLLERGFHLYFINPKQLDRFRDRHTLAGAKDDRRDAFVLADSLRTDRACFLRVEVDDPRIIELRELTRIDEEITAQRGRLCNRLREQFGRFFPQILELVPAADERWLWSLLELVPTPEAARNVRPRQVSVVLKRHGIRRLTVPQIIEILRGPSFQVAPGTSEAASEHICFLLPQLQLLDEQRRQCQKRIDTALAAMPNLSNEAEQGEHRDVDILLSLPGIGKNVAAAMLVEATQPLRERDYHSLRARAGVAPVTRQSGKSRTGAFPISRSRERP
jgi:transposase